MCKCFETAGDEHDNTVLMICGHRPNCPEFEINPREFTENVRAEAQQIADRLLIEEMPKLKAMYERMYGKPRKSPAITENKIQCRLFTYLQQKGHYYIAPNAKIFHTGEMDVCSVLKKSGFLNEYEIKLSRGDFKKDFKKKLKHKILAREETSYKTWGGKIFEYTSPNYFYFVTPKDLVTEDELPVYAGLIYFDAENFAWHKFEVVKKAVLIHSTPISTADKFNISKALMWRCWTAKEKL